MFKRIMTSVVGIAIGLVILYFSRTIVVNIVIAVLSCLAVFELFRALKCLDNKTMTGISLGYSAVMPFVYLLYLKTGNHIVLDTASILFVTAICTAYLPKHKKMPFEKFFFVLSVPLFISFSLNSIYLTSRMSDQHCPVYIALILCGAWIADSAAFFTGTFFGKHKLCPEISPKKTIEGFIGGVLGNGIFFVIFNLIYVSFFAKNCGVNYISSFFLGVICALIGTVGDLTASIIKRNTGIKDFGKVMPGHGGIVDRFDSVFFVAPFMYAYLSLFKIYV